MMMPIKYQSEMSTAVSSSIPCLPPTSLLHVDLSASPSQTAMPTLEDDGCITERSPGPNVIRSGETLQPSSRDIQPSLEARNVVPPGACGVLSREPGCPPFPMPSSQSASESSSCTTSYASSASSEDLVDNVMSSIDRHSAKKRENELACAIGQIAESLVHRMPFSAQLQFMEKMLTVIKDINGAVVAGEHQTLEK